MTDTVTLQSLNDKLDAVLAKLTDRPAQPPAFAEAYQHRELMASEIDPTTIDGEFVQIDGSTWVYDQGRPVCRIYGYISKEKDPAMWDRMVSAVGSEERLVELLGHSPYTRYANKPDSFLLTTAGPERLNLLSYTLAGALPPMMPTGR